MKDIQKQETGFKFGKYRLKVLEEYGEVIHNGRKYKLVKVQTNDNLEYISLRLYNKNNKFIKQLLMEPGVIKGIIGLLGNMSGSRSPIIRVGNDVSTRIDTIEEGLKSLLNGDEPFKEEFNHIKKLLLILKGGI